jgi:predicted dehydrogenase
MRFSEEFEGAGHFGRYEEAVASPSVDAVYFMTPHHVHVENVLLASRHSKHIMMEKPIARTLDESRKIIAAARDAGVKLMIAENYRFLPTLVRAKAMIADGDIGEVRLVEATQGGNNPPTGWRENAELRGGGTLIDGGIHYIDALVNLGGFPEQVYASMLPKVHPTGGEDGVEMSLRYPGGAVGHLSLDAGSQARDPRNEMTVAGTKGRLSFAPFGDEVIVETPSERRTVRLPEGNRGSLAMVTEFARCIAEDREPAVTGEVGLEDLSVVLAAYRSAERGAAVSPTRT